MFYDGIPAIPLGQFINSSTGLFSLTLRTVFGQPVMAFFASVSLFLGLIALLAWLIHQGKSGRI